MQGDGLIVDVKESGMVDGGIRHQAKQFYRLDGQQTNDAPHYARRQITDRYEQ